MLESRDDSALGPAPRDEDGRFENFRPGLPRAGFTVTFPFFLRRATSRFRTPAGLPETAPVDNAWLAANERPDEPTVTWIGHATLLIQMDGVNFLTDPVWSKTAGPGGIAGARRWNEPGRTLDQLPPIDFVLISHNHYDHLDLSTLRELASRHSTARFLVPLGNAALLQGEGIERVVELDWGEQHAFGRVTIHCLPAQHWSQRGIGDRRKALWASWAVVGPTRRFYFSGDTGAFDRFARIGATLGPFDLAGMAIGAYEPVEMMRFSHLDPEEAVDAALDLRARRMLAIHYGTFDLADEPPGEPPERFRAAARARGVPDADAWIFALGEARRF
jgi:N-acyl-phosphatidylethanolamine-hydrolysing phospholipase D